MSRGPGKLQRYILERLRDSETSMGAADLRFGYEHDLWEPNAEGWDDFERSMTAQRRRAIRISVGRALRQLAAAGEIKRDGDGNLLSRQGLDGAG
jgi:hypothetical protein